MSRALELELGRPSDGVAGEILDQLRALSRSTLAVLIAAEQTRLVVEDRYFLPEMVRKAMPAKAAFAARSRLIELEAAEAEL